MKTVSLLAALIIMSPWSYALSQDLVINNARIITGGGETIEEGSIIVTEGRISSLSADAVVAGTSAVIDAKGMTVLPGLIDVHRHDLLGDLRGFAELSSDAAVAEAVEQKAPASMQASIADIHDLARVQVVIQEGIVTVDKTVSEVPPPPNKALQTDKAKLSRQLSHRSGRYLSSAGEPGR